MGASMTKFGKILVTADLHFDLYEKQAYRKPNGVTDRTLDVQKAVMSMGDYAKQNGIEHIIVAGDTFNTKDSTSVALFKIVYETFEYVHNLGISVILLAGNHDQASRMEDVVSIIGLQGLATIVVSPTVMEIAGYQVFLVPYTARYTEANIVELLEQRNLELPSILIAHVGITGAVYSDFEVRAKGEIDSSKLHSENFDLVVLGHYHHPQYLSPTVLYAGAPIQHTFSDINSKRVFRVIEIVKGKRHWTPCVTDVEVTGVPVFRYVTLQEYEANHLAYGERDFVKILDVDEASLATVMLKDSRVRGSKNNSVTATRARTEVDIEDNITTIVDTYLKTHHKAMQTANLDSKVVANIGLEILQEAMLGNTNILASESLAFSLTMQGFMAFGDEETVVDFSNPGLTLIQGDNRSSISKSSNGSGKSTVFAGLLFGLFGKVNEDILLQDLVNVESKFAKVCVTVTKSDGTCGIITRYINHPKHKNKCTFTVDSNSISASTTVKLQEVIDAFLGMTKEVFVSTIFCSVPVAALRPSEIDRLFSDLLGLAPYEEARKLNTKRLQEYESLLNGARNEASKLELGQQFKEEQLANLQSTLKHTQEMNILLSNETILADKNKALKEIKELEASQEPLFISMQELKVQIEALEEEYDKSFTEENSIRKVLSSYRDTYSFHKGNYSALKLALDKETQLISDGQCPVCRATVTEESLGETYIGMQTQVSELDKQMKLCLLESNIEDQKLSVAQAVSDAKLKELNKLKADFNSAQSQFHSISLQLASVKATYDSLTVSDTSLESLILPLQEQIATVTEELDTLGGQLADLEEVIVFDYEDKVKSHKFWVEGFGPMGIRNMLIDSILPALNEIIARCCEVLTSGELSVIFKGQSLLATGETRDKLFVEVSDRFGSSKYFNESSGEKRRVDLIISLAIYCLISRKQNAGMILLDEVFVKLDTAGRQSMIKLLRYMLKEIPSIFIISNLEAIISEDFDTVLTVIREGQISRLERI
jgi:DNA repair exonuclease SbcCD ATPase subunit/DNA repair exonuclease SbcCD nuclease subunit